MIDPTGPSSDDNSIFGASSSDDSSDVVVPPTVGDDNQPFTPELIQETKEELMDLLDQIKALLATKKGNVDVTFKLQFAMYLMQQFGGERVGLQSEAQNKMDKVNQIVSNMWTYLYAAKTQDGTEWSEHKVANNPENFYYDTTDSGSNHCVNTAKFMNSLLDLENVAQNPEYIPDPNMSADLLAQLKGMANVVFNDDADCGLGWLWKQYGTQITPINPTGGGNTAPGDPTDMDVIMRGMGQLNQTFAGQSSAIAAVTKVQTKLYQTETNNYNAYMKAMMRWENMAIQAQKTG